MMTPDPRAEDLNFCSGICPPNRSPKNLLKKGSLKNSSSCVPPVVTVEVVDIFTTEGFTDSATPERDLLSVSRNTDASFVIADFRAVSPDIVSDDCITGARVVSSFGLCLQLAMEHMEKNRMMLNISDNRFLMDSSPPLYILLIILDIGKQSSLLSGNLSVMGCNNCISASFPRSFYRESSPLISGYPINRPRV
jgi:hypothetical protein